MNISIFGLGYVGSVTSGCLAREGHRVIGVDLVETKINMINTGKSPIIEKKLDQIIAQAVSDRKLYATLCSEEAIIQTDLSFICVGTPGMINGEQKLSHVRQVCEEIGWALKKKNAYHTVVIRSTIFPGTMRNMVIPTLEKTSGKQVGRDFGVCYNPDFLREGNAVDDFYHPPKTVIGEMDLQSGDLLEQLYSHLNAPLVRVSIEIAEMVKYVDNAWHALKVGFANEVGNLCRALNIDEHEVMNIFCRDNKLNLSPSYLTPGFAFGGACMPKDLRTLTHKGRTLDVELPIINSILPSNILQIERGLRLIMSKGNRKIGILGLSFKAGTDDLRESPMVEVIRRLISKGYNVCIYDKDVNLSRLVGANRDFILNAIPHISNLLADSIEQVILHAETLVVGNAHPLFKCVVNDLSTNKAIVDLVQINHFLSDYETSSIYN
ncbi:MAG: nucleotide sugar dehydrogenase [Desulfobacteraceae bacterium]